MRRTLSILVVTVFLLGVGAGRAGAVPPEQINKAVDRGVAALRKLQNGGLWPHNEIGLTALAGLTLLECDVSPDDKVLVEAAGHIRTQVPTLATTYSISLAIMFFDRLGDVGDIPLIESLSLRLIAGQGKDGGWAYHCPIVGSQLESERLVYLISKRSGHTPFRRGKDANEKKRTKDDLSPEIKILLKKISNGDYAVKAPASIISDNSNTQFATLALWIAA